MLPITQARVDEITPKSPQIEAQAVSSTIQAGTLALAQFQAIAKPVVDGLPPILKRIASCESTGDVNAPPRQFNDDGSILWGHDPTGKVVMRDVGEMQINLWAHGAEIQKLGLDVIHSQKDNLKYALILYERNGTKDWDASFHCWH